MELSPDELKHLPTNGEPPDGGEPIVEVDYGDC